ncbi:CBS domain-containing protein [Tessaracoccus flavus]|jgi:CBS domain-containing protein|uniref:Uncharacterized protein n=1 Tax=Tessaracoccus flavus TaxID=1610493 RepID=A0A1Q2CEI5_9ACTN|nr:CBS domain-containing protein [Tessaracoccus flavus]AQP44516.1 hypothetical protein RPIT_06575 [Tessaracoccus flavus]SDY71878.1 CBS domain-containing protein [Tessaracoccus flavus]
MKTARDLMTSPAHTLSPSDTLVEAARQLSAHGVGSMPVVDGGALVGVLTDRDIVVGGIAEGHDPASTPVSVIATTDVVSVSPDDDAQAVATAMSEHQIRRVPVVEDGKVVGVVSQADVALELDNSTAGEVVEGISR